jgi:hypothetical protein
MKKKAENSDETDVLHVRLRKVNIDFLRELAARDDRTTPNQLDRILTSCRENGLFECPEPNGE